MLPCLQQSFDRDSVQIKREAMPQQEATTEGGAECRCESAAWPWHDLFSVLTTLENTKYRSTPVKKRQSSCSRSCVGNVRVKNTWPQFCDWYALICKTSLHITQQDYIKIQLPSYINSESADQLLNETVKTLEECWESAMSVLPTAHVIPLVCTQHM
jgi:hypothetical protein